MSLEPIVQFFNRDTDEEFTSKNPWDVGTVKAGEQSTPLRLRVWNNRGGQTNDIDETADVDNMDLEAGTVTFTETKTGDVIADYDHKEEIAVDQEVLTEKPLTETATSTETLSNWGDTTVSGGDDDIYNIDIVFTDTASEGSESTSFDSATNTLTIDLASGGDYYASAIETLIRDSATTNTPYGFDWSLFQLNVTNDVLELTSNLIGVTFSLSGGKDINTYKSSSTVNITEMSSDVTITGNATSNSDLTVEFTESASSGSESASFDAGTGVLTLDLASGTAYSASDLQGIVQAADSSVAPHGVDFSTWTVEQAVSGGTATGTALIAYSFNLQGGQGATKATAEKTISEMSADLKFLGNKTANSNIDIVITESASSTGDENTSFDSSVDPSELTINLASSGSYGASDLEELIKDTDNTDAPKGVDFSTWTVEQSDDGSGTVGGTALVAYSPFSLSGGEHAIVGQKFKFANTPLVPNTVDLFIQAELVPSGDIVEINHTAGYVDLSRDTEITNDVVADYEYFSGNISSVTGEVLTDSGDALTFTFTNTYIIESSLDLREGGDASHMKDVRLYVAAPSYNYIVTDGWVVAKEVSLTGTGYSSFTRVFDGDEVPLGSSVHDSEGLRQIDGTVNDGSDTATANYGDIDLRVDPVDNAPHGSKEFNIVVEYFYT